MTVQFVRLKPCKLLGQLSPKEAPMSTTAVTMEELESERAELLPSRETLTTCGSHSAHSSFTSVFVNQNRSEEHTSELQSHSDLVCRLLLEKKKNKHI